jgi:hypothetical protein
VGFSPKGKEVNLMPWGISHKYKFIFIHIPKTAGTTICSSWEGSLLKKTCKYFKWAVVRNPFDRFVSKFFFKQLNPREDFNLEWTDKEGEGLLPQMYWITDRTYLKGPKKDTYYRPDFRGCLKN